MPERLNGFEIKMITFYPGKIIDQFDIIYLNETEA